MLANAGIINQCPSIPIRVLNNIEENPFKKSPQNTIAAGFLPTLWRTFEAPASPVPLLKMFTPLRLLIW